MRRIPMHMANWVAKLDASLSLNDREILHDAGKISHELALETAHDAYERFQEQRGATRDAEGSDFDKAVSQLPSRLDSEAAEFLEDVET